MTKIIQVIPDWWPCINTLIENQDWVMLTSNINIENRLICEQMATVKHIEIRDKEVQTIFLELDD